jgi:hypothetical protein
MVRRGYKRSVNMALQSVPAREIPVEAWKGAGLPISTQNKKGVLTYQLSVNIQVKPRLPSSLDSNTHTHTHTHTHTQSDISRSQQGKFQERSIISQHNIPPK